ncbi:MAG: helix-turn-helix transcriptional regulator [Alphaproteobacteria bacterium]|nr:helix-turn-helix transcriptional regulator [Alphaproteobacteria bacterium]
MALACDMLGDRWTMLIVREAFYGVSRFDDLRADLGIPRGILSARLKALVGSGVLERHPYREGSARVRHDYRLSERGRDLGLALIALMQWGDRHLQEAPSPLRITDRRTGAPLQVALVTPDGRAVAAADVDVAAEV